VSRSLSDAPGRIVPIEPERCSGCQGPLAGAWSAVAERPQVVDLPPVSAPLITEYQLLAKTCRCCGTVSTADWAGAEDANTAVLAPPGSPVRIGPRALAMCVLLTCGHYLPVGRATALLDTLTGLHLATGFTARSRRRAAQKLAEKFLPHMQELLSAAPLLHADETTGRAAGALAWVHVACTEYLTLLHSAAAAAPTSTTAGYCPASPVSWSATATPATTTCPPCTPGAVPTWPGTCGRSPTPTPKVNCGPPRWPTPWPPPTRPPARPANRDATGWTQACWPP